MTKAEMASLIENYTNLSNSLGKLKTEVLDMHTKFRGMGVMYDPEDNIEEPWGPEYLKKINPVTEKMVEEGFIVEALSVLDTSVTESMNTMEELVYLLNEYKERYCDD